MGSSFHFIIYLALVFPTLCISRQNAVNGGWGQWTSFSHCSVSCGGGIQVRQRECDNPSPANGGQHCYGTNTDRQTLNGGWGQWTSFSHCSRSCGGGTQIRQRECDNPSPANGGQQCSGTNIETQACNTNLCSAEQWTMWTSYKPCSQTCGIGERSRSRDCIGGDSCIGASRETIKCDMGSCPCSGSHCPVNGGWGQWTSFSHCSRSCGGGTQIRQRECDNPSPANGGQQCSGTNIETQACNTNLCSAEQWTMWTSYKPCSQTCGTGERSRSRDCIGGDSCIGASRETIKCDMGSCPCSGSHCPVNGGWGNWLSFSACSVTCGTGSQTRIRYCNNPAPRNNGSFCTDIFP